MQNRLGIFVVLAAIFSLVSPQAGYGKDVSFYAKQEVAKGWDAFHAGDSAAALRSFSQATVIDPDYAPGYYGKGHAYISQNQIGLAISNFKKTIELADPPLVGAYVNLGLALVIAGRDQEGLRMYNRALSLDPLNKEAHLNLANFYCASLNGKKAWEHVRFVQKMGGQISDEQLAEMKSLCPENE